MKIKGARKTAKRTFDSSVFNPSPRDWANWKKAFHFGVRFAENAYKAFNKMQWAVMEDGNTKAVFADLAEAETDAEERAQGQGGEIEITIKKIEWPTEIEEHTPVLLTARGVNPFLIRGAWERIAVTEVLEAEFGCNCSIVTSEEQFQLAEQIKVSWQCPEGANLPGIFTVHLLNEYKI